MILYAFQKVDYASVLGKFNRLTDKLTQGNNTQPKTQAPPYKLEGFNQS